ncbi:MAG TPA: DNA-directed RNA polymerase subunit L [Candidatus Syntrophoarchaeum butanivorans]|uniref:DNA-directed RNA polymerase subunit Rpo11 n=1 Tax=Candidatus Syntropharchaeum butanivorans TaxID=1839936 RepID=A0A7C0X4X1_9EURY|nr:MAG: DNA-directed RNA polymerase subunit L [Candidatus Syntrophoarchaeum sp. WYZ-LMO15]HDM36667.1 DNA-directed RNA polymerase subunit L [Candidatus Syntrophoarchaeum butanivorans]HEC56373.1 DNA-directed RNA polymerase subunit L [Candidatus Syntrophoarchaeum butanivorans]
MELKVLEERENELEIEVIGEGHTMMNLLKSSLLDDPDVLVATYDIKFPTISNPILYIRTREGRNPYDAIKDAVDRIITRFDELSDAITGVLI